MDIGHAVAQALTTWFQHLAETVTPAALRAAGWLLFQTPAFDSFPDVQRLWTIALGVADTWFVLAAVAAGVLVMSSGTYHTIYSAKLLLPRLVLAAVLTNLSLVICHTLIQFENALVVALVGPHADSDIWAHLAAGAASGDPATVVLSAFVAIAIAVIAVILVIAYIARDLALLVATVVAPLALATHSLPQIDWVARLWWRIYGLALFVQVLQAELASVGFQLVEHSSWLGTPFSPLINSLVLLTLLYAAVKLPFAAFRWASGQGIWDTRAGQFVQLAAMKLTGRA